MSADRPQISEDFLIGQVQSQKYNAPSFKVSDKAIIYMMKKFDCNKTHVAEKVGLSRRQLIRRCKELEENFPFLKEKPS